MQTLKRLLAHGVVDALQTQEHVVVAPGCHQALADEVQEVVAPMLRAVAAQVEDAAARSRAAEAAVEHLAGEIAERLLESGNIDDIFAEDRLIRRDTYRAARSILLRYVGGELDVAQQANRSGESVVALDELGYVVATVALHADDVLLEGALMRAATACSTTLTAIDMKTRRAVFSAERPIPALPLQEAITEALTNLVRADLVDLPSMEQILEVSATTRAHSGFRAALSDATAAAEERTSCLTACNMLDEHTLLATLTPLSTEDAHAAESHFHAFIAILEDRLGALESKAPESSERATESQTSVRTKGRKRKATPSQKRAPRESRSRAKKTSAEKPAPRKAATSKKAAGRKILAAFPGKH